ncbi:uncharacterized protein RCC_08727 [Ramularia collo-cygni]|uniref:Uncharacterized protein n=1 Tax=Ramularia collo-cygni TaxID=112498 RepID=A0A2D3UY76_9PEZI|nr:uncharacterized protein RCC_08727 [Ramularia collo-cygni]CZT23017.1 uncharacterized protein RCC_08727 [Ramularia collo-cygni]
MQDIAVVEVINGQLTIVSGERDHPVIVRVKVPCNLAKQRDYGVPPALFSNGTSSISREFPNTSRLELQFDFRNQTTGWEDVGAVEFGNWIRDMVKAALALDFATPCDVFVAVTDSANLYSDRGGDLVALGMDGDGGDNPAVVIMGAKGRLVHVGMTNYK